MGHKQVSESKFALFKLNVSISLSGGHYNYIVSRPLLYDMMLRLIPAQKLRFGKRVLSISQGEHGVLIRTSDGQTHEGDILVGADGAYSAVRQSLYGQLKRDNKLPSSDDQPLPFTCVALVGQTYPLDPAKFPELDRPDCLNHGVISATTPYSVSLKQHCPILKPLGHSIVLWKC